MTPDQLKFPPCALLLCTLMLTGCADTVRVKAEYHGLEGKPFAVLVASTPQIAADYPAAVRRVTEAMVDRLRIELPHYHVVDAEHSVKFMEDNPRWSLRPYSSIARTMDVDRLLLIELVEFQLHPPGNPHLFQASLTARVGVALCDGARPDDLDYTRTLKVIHPDSRGVGLAHGIPTTATTAEDVSLKMLEKFTTRTVWLFKDHREPIQ